MAYDKALFREIEISYHKTLHFGSILVVHSLSVFLMSGKTEKNDSKTEENAQTYLNPSSRLRSFLWKKTGAIRNRMVHRYHGFVRDIPL